MHFDTHTHVNFAAFKEDQEPTIKRALDQGVWFANIGTSYATSKEASELAEKYREGVYATIGLHPVHTWQTIEDHDESENNNQESFDAEKYKQLISKKVVAVGEIGLDYFRIPSENTEAKKLQKNEFAKQLAFAKDNNLPIVIHCREAYDDVLEILDSEYEGQGIMHSFTDTWETAKKFLDRGFYIAFNGILLFDKSGKLTEVCKNTPSDRILTETDAPYLAPPPYRGKRNEPAYVKIIAQEIAKIRFEEQIKVENYTFENALNVYGIKKPAI